MRLIQKFLATAMVCLAGTAPALAIAADAKFPSSPNPGHVRSPNSSPLAALGGSTFDPQSLTGAVTLERLIIGLMEESGRYRWDDPLAAPGFKRPTSEQIAHARTALRRSGVEFDFRVVKARKLSSDCPKEVDSTFAGGIAPHRREICTAYVEDSDPPVESVSLVGTLASQGVANSTFVLSRPGNRGSERREGEAEPRCVDIKAKSRLPLSDASALNAQGVSPANFRKENQVLVLRVVATVDASVIRRDDRLFEKAANVGNGGEGTCLQSVVWTYEIPSSSVRN